MLTGLGLQEATACVEDPGGIAVDFPCCQNELLPVDQKVEDTVVRSRAQSARASHRGCEHELALAQRTVMNTLGASFG